MLIGLVWIGLGAHHVQVLIMIIWPTTMMTTTTTTTMMACLDGTGAHLYNFPMQQLMPQQALSRRGLENLSSTQLIVLLNFNQYLDIYLCSMTKNTTGKSADLVRSSWIVFASQRSQQAALQAERHALSSFVW